MNANGMLGKDCPFVKRFATNFALEGSFRIRVVGFQMIVTGRRGSEGFFAQFAKIGLLIYVTEKTTKLLLNFVPLVYFTNIPCYYLY